MRRPDRCKTQVLLVETLRTKDECSDSEMEQILETLDKGLNTNKTTCNQCNGGIVETLT